MEKMIRVVSPDFYHQVISAARETGNAYLQLGSREWEIIPGTHPDIDFLHSVDINKNSLIIKKHSES